MSAQTEKVLVVVPCFNEALRLPVDEFLQYIRQQVDVDFLFVNDGSSDATQAVIENLVSKQPDRLYYLHLKQNHGKAEAVRQGILFGLQNMSSEYDFLAFIDADLATPLSEIRYLLDYAQFRGGGKKFVFGSRLKVLGSNIERNPFRHYFGRISATGASVSLSLPVYDTQCGIKIFHHSVCEAIFSRVFLSRWLFDVELFFRFKSLMSKQEFDQSVLEVPLRAWLEIPGTKISFSDILKVPFELWRINRKYAGTSRF